jgi:L-lactate dehydrogenase complex protein LldE
MRVALFATCVVDQLVPQVGLAVLRVLRRHGVSAEFPPGQTCCGQPLFNSGYREEARTVARTTLEVLRPFDAVVVPSGSCCAMIRVHYRDLFAPDDPVQQTVAAVGERTFEFSEFLVKKLGVTKMDPVDSGPITFHDGCHSLRELGIKDEPRRLLAAAGCAPIELADQNQCCGFGGTFSVKFDKISASMGEAKAKAIAATGAGTVVSCDPSCLLQIAGILARRGIDVRAIHLAELLASPAAP